MRLGAPASQLRNAGRKSWRPTLEPLIGDRINVGQIASQWGELLRLATSIRQGTVTASLVLRKLASYPWLNGLAWGLREIGRIDRTLFPLAWLHSPELRRRVTVGLNKGEAKNALSRAVCFHRRGIVQDRTLGTLNVEHIAAMLVDGRVRFSGGTDWKGVD